MIRTLLITLSLAILAAPLCRGQYAVQQQQSVGMGGYGAAVGQAPVLAAPVGGGCAVGAAVQAAPLYHAPVVQQAPVVLQAAPAYVQQSPVVVQAAPAYATVAAAPVVVQQAPVYVQRQAVGGYGYGVGAGVGRGVVVGHGLVGRAVVAPSAGNQRIKQKQKTVIRPARRGLFGRL
jgi:hypothetical protein